MRVCVKNVLFRTFCTPLYTCQLWSRYTARSLHKLYVAYNNAFRMMHHLPTYCSASEMFTVNRVPNCAAVIRNLTFKFMSRLDTQPTRSNNCKINPQSINYTTRKSNVFVLYFELSHGKSIPNIYNIQCPYIVVFDSVSFPSDH